MKFNFFKKDITKVEKVYLGVLYIIGFGLTIYTPISVWLTSMWPRYEIYFKSWKELLIIVAFGLAIYIIYKRKLKLPHAKLIKLITTYNILYVLLAIVLFQGFLATVAGLMIDLRYLAYFLLMLFAAYSYDDFTKQYLRVVFVGGTVVAIFALLQVYVLPTDFLSYIGYSKDTILPYLMVDQNPDFIRINSSLRGPNPLGAYMVVFITVLGVWLYKNYKSLNTKQSWLMAVVMVGAIVGLWFSYSRSALMAMLISLLIVLVFMFYKKITAKTILISGSIGLVLVIGLVFARNNEFVSSVFFHDNIDNPSKSISNVEHVDSLKEGLNRLADYPIGAGVGTTGSASMFTDTPYIVENQYLFIAHEAGWAGLALFLIIQIYVLYLLWKKSNKWLPMAVFASGIGLAVIGIILPVWADDTVSILWWGMAGLALGAKHYD